MSGNWRQTYFKRLDGAVEMAADNWTLVDDEDQSLARIFRFSFGPNTGRWAWTVLGTTKGSPSNCATGYADTELDAREECERRIADRVMLKPKK